MNSIEKNFDIPKQLLLTLEYKICVYDEAGDHERRSSKQNLRWWPWVWIHEYSWNIQILQKKFDYQRNSLVKGERYMR